MYYIRVLFSFHGMLSIDSFAHRALKIWYHPPVLSFGLLDVRGFRLLFCTISKRTVALVQVLLKTNISVLQCTLPYVGVAPEGAASRNHDLC